MAQVLRQLKTKKYPRALVGFATNDDAAVFRLSSTMAVVETVDFFPPVVDDPFTFGEIAAANALSDIYAMGAKPLFALNLVCFPVKALPLTTLSQILAGGQAKAEEASIPILGGHSIEDPEPKYGLCVTGLVHPRRILTNAGAQAGDVLLLTKPLGSGIATTAIKRGVADAALAARAIAVMRDLNRRAGEAFASGTFKVHALTDVTGFGLLGHLTEMMFAAKTRARLRLEQLPIIAGVPALADAGIVPAGTQANLDHFGRDVRFPKGLPLAIQQVLADAQTNGGLLGCVPARDLTRALRALARRKVDVSVVGEVMAGKPGVDVVG